MIRLARLTVLLGILLACGVFAVGQQADFNGLLYAAEFAKWSMPSGQIGYSWPGPCTVVTGGLLIHPFVVGTPVFILDANPAQNEIVTPSVVQSSNIGCSVSFSPAPFFAHRSYQIVSATAGLQEAINWAQRYSSVSSTPTSVIVLTPEWTTVGGTTGTITAAHGSTPVSILDERTAQCASYSWNGSAYVGSSGCGTAQVQSDWNETNNLLADYIKNKPTIPGAQVNSDWNASSGVAQILNKPTLSSAGGPQYSVQFNDPLGSLNGTANLITDTNGNLTSAANIAGSTLQTGVSLFNPLTLGSGMMWAHYQLGHPRSSARLFWSPDGTNTHELATEQDIAGNSGLANGIGMVKAADCGTGFVQSSNSDGSWNCAANSITTQFTPPVGGTYAILYPTTVSNYTGGNGTAKCIASGSGQIWRVYGSGLSDYAVWCNWGGFSLPSYISAGTVTSVYAVVNSIDNGNGGILALAAGQGTAGFSFPGLPTFSGSAWSLPVSSGVVGQLSALLASGGSAASFDFASTSITADNAASTGGTFNDVWNVNSVALVVFYSGTQQPQNPGVQVVPPLGYNPALNTLSMMQATGSADGWLSHTDFQTFNAKQPANIGSTPADNATCGAGQQWFDASYLYLCTASGTVKRIALSSF